jgi:hypothetical protein
MGENEGEWGGGSVILHKSLSSVCVHEGGGDGVLRFE